MKQISIPRNKFLWSVWTSPHKRILIMIPFIIGAAYYRRDKIDIALFVFFTTVLADIVFRFYADKLRLNTDKQMVQVHLNSLMAGEKVMSFPLYELKADLKEYTGFKAFWFGTTVLIFQNKNRRGFRITPTYGFTAADLKQFYQWLMETKTETHT